MLYNESDRKQYTFVLKNAAKIATGLVRTNPHSLIKYIKQITSTGLAT